MWHYVAFILTIARPTMNAVEFITIFFSVIFLGFVLSYYALLFFRKSPPRARVHDKSVTVIIPAHNEQEHIAECISAVLASHVPGKKNIIVIDDGSTDETFKIASSFKPKISLIKTEHSGKSST